MNRSDTYKISSIFVPLVMVFVIALCCEAAVAEGQLRFVSVKPTVFFMHEGDVITQLGEATIDNLSQEQIEVILQTQIPGRRMRDITTTVPKDKATIQFPFPNISKPEQVTFILKVDGKEHDRHSMTWQPQRKWRVYFIPITHHDLGYTDTIENVLNRYAGFYDDILRFCRETDDWPDEAKYRYTAEGAWAMQHFIETRDEEDIEELGKYVKLNRIEIGALMGNEISALCRACSPDVPFV